MRIRVLPLLLAVTAALVAAVTGVPTTAADPSAKSAAQWLAEWSQNWDEAKWEKQFRTAPNGFMRPLDDPGWKKRMVALQGIVSQGKDAIPALAEALKSQETPRRIFAAQALGYLAPDVPIGPLLKAAKNDPDAAVRLYAIDSLGMQGARDVDFAALEQAEASGDVKKHIGYARERQGEPLDPAVVGQLRQWSPETIDSATVGRAAPNFELKAASGERIRLSGFRGKSAVVLVFIYGDT